MADRFDVIEQTNDTQFNTVSFYGYVRGTYLDKFQRIHVNGLGDYDIKSIQRVDDPCPIELKKTVKQRQQEHLEEKLGQSNKKKKRNLKDKERVLYAPFSNIGSMNFEKATGSGSGAGYITIPDKYVVYTKLNQEGEDAAGNLMMNEEGVLMTGGNKQQGNEGQQMVWKLQEADRAMDEREIEAPMLLSGVAIKEDHKDEQWKPKKEQERTKH